MAHVALLARSLALVFLAMAAACAGSRGPDGNPLAASQTRTLVGKLLLPSGSGNRGVELMIRVTGDEDRVAWVLFDEQGRFAHGFQGSLTRVTVTAGPEVYRADTEDLPEASQAGQIDLGVIDLRDRLTGHRVVVRAADGSPAGDVRVGMWFGPPPVGPQGEPVSLGSRQFPSAAMGSELDWLLPNEVDSIYFVVERPSGSGRGAEWRSGHQRHFGPFTSSTLPAELIMD